LTGFAEKARQARISVLNMIHEAGSSHIGSNYSAIDVLTVLFDKMSTASDEFICSKGWIAASIYYFLSEKGVLPKEELTRYCKPGEEVYIGLVEPQGKWGLRAAGGAVGYGLSFAVGFGLSKKLKGDPGNVFVLMSDGEMDVGMVYESMLHAAHLQLDNVIAIIDKNNFQATGRPSEVLNIEPIDEKWKNCGWVTLRCDGHDHNAIESTLERAINLKGDSPKVIIADTVKGKGVSFMEDQLKWHYLDVNDEHYRAALKELNHVS
jgi:transketolase